MLVATLAAPLALRADPGVLRIVTREPAPTPGDHFEVELELTLGDGERGPLMLTPRVEGAAFEIVRGRLLTSDARDPTASPLRFSLPAIARAQGSATLIVELDAFSCDARDRCEPLHRESTALVTIAPPSQR